jgi:hypothetical protein
VGCIDHCMTLGREHTDDVITKLNNLTALFPCETTRTGGE